MNRTSRALGGAFVVAALSTAALFTAAVPAAVAGVCPAGQTGVDVMPASTAPAMGVTDDVISSIDVASQPAAIQGRQFRLRRLVIRPGGVVPYHSHGDRPAIIYVVQGEVTEYASTCREPIVHRAGESTPELSGTSHWWKNTGTTPAVLLSADLLRVAGPDASM